MNYKYILIAMIGSGVLGAANGIAVALHDHLLTRHLSRGDMEILHDAYRDTTSRFLRRRFGDIVVSTQMGLTRRVLIGALHGFMFGACLPISLLWAVLHAF